MPTLSVIVPNYNHGQLLPACLNAMLRQSVQPHEIIIIDDGSTDNSVEVMEDFVRRYPQIKMYRNEVNCGVLKTLNRAIGLATGDFISAFAAAAFGAALVMALPGFSPPVEAGSSMPVDKSDRLDYRPVGTDCSQEAWPYFQADCLHDRAQTAGQARTIRLVTAERR